MSQDQKPTMLTVSDLLSGKPKSYDFGLLRLDLRPPTFDERFEAINQAIVDTADYQARAGLKDDPPSGSSADSLQARPLADYHNHRSLIHQAARICSKAVLNGEETSFASPSQFYEYLKNINSAAADHLILSCGLFLMEARKVLQEQWKDPFHPPSPSLKPSSPGEGIPS